MNPSPYKRSPQVENWIKTALTKAVVYFHDGNRRKFYSRDFKGNNPSPNRELGLWRLKKEVEKCHNEPGKLGVKQAIIYDSKTEVELFTFKDGTWL